MDTEESQAMIDNLVRNAMTAQNEYKKLDQDAIDRIVKAMTLAGIDKHMELAKSAIEETNMGTRTVVISKINCSCLSSPYISLFYFIMLLYTSLNLLINNNIK